MWLIQLELGFVNHWHSLLLQQQYIIITVIIIKAIFIAQVRKSQCN